MSDNKVAFSSGKLNGTKTLLSTLEAIETPDDIEKFLLDFINLKIEFEITNETTYINDDQDFLEIIPQVESSEYISIYTTETFSRLYITTDNKKTYIIRLNKVSTALIASFIAKDSPIKFSINSFSFIKWCNTKQIDTRNIYDIPTYIKLLTNDVDPFKKIDEYIKEYTNYELDEEDNEKNSIIIGNFIYEFGKYLSQYVQQFNQTTICKLINENSYYETNPIENPGNCTISIGYINLDSAIQSIAKEKIHDFNNKSYVTSPLNRISPKFGYDKITLLEELYKEDVTITILNEFYNNNIPVRLDENGNYTILCKYKNFNSVITLVNAILNDVFYTLFEHNSEIQMNCIIKEWYALSSISFFFIHQESYGQFLIVACV